MRASKEPLMFIFIFYCNSLKLISMKLNTFKSQNVIGENNLYLLQSFSKASTLQQLCSKKKGLWLGKQGTAGKLVSFAKPQSSHLENMVLIQTHSQGSSKSNSPPQGRWRLAAWCIFMHTYITELEMML